MNGAPVLRAAVAVVAVVALLLAGAWLLQRRLVYLPSTGPVGPPPAGVSEVGLQTGDGLELTAWWLEPTGPARDTAVLVLPGNAGDRSLRVPLARGLAAAGFAVLLVDYRGYGGNPGHPTEDGLAADAGAAYRYLAERHGVVAPVVFGESLGAAVAARLATERPVAALVLRSPFTSLADVAAVHYPLPPAAGRLLLRDRFPVSELVTGVPATVTVVLGERDGIVPPAQSRAVATAAGATVVEVAGANHNDAILNSGPQVIAAVVDAVSAT
jgi:fermentation-respiration switch protein FrsA (DUF1100 family)